MTNLRIVTKEQLDERRDKIRSLLARGYTRPGRILQELKDEYKFYRSPYERVRNDIAAVKKMNVELMRWRLVDVERAAYIDRLEEALMQCWVDYEKLNGMAKVNLMKCIIQVSKDIARAHGINTDVIDPKICTVENIFADPKWWVIQDRLLELLDPYSEIRDALVETIEKRIEESEREYHDHFGAVGLKKKEGSRRIPVKTHDDKTVTLFGML